MNIDQEIMLFNTGHGASIFCFQIEPELLIELPDIFSSFFFEMAHEGVVYKISIHKPDTATKIA